MIKVLSEIDQKEIIKGFKARFIHTATNTIGYVEIEKGAVLPEHSHHHEQITQITEGTLKMVVNNETCILNAGSIIIIPPNAKHSAIALKACKVIDVFSPVREDYK